MRVNRYEVVVASAYLGQQYEQGPVYVLLCTYIYDVHSVSVSKVAWD